MWLLLCASTDHAALWAYDGLRKRGLNPLELVTSELLGAARWEHRVSNSSVSVEISLHDGRRISSENITGVVNRLIFVPAECSQLIHPSDRHYATQELNAFFVSWLNALPGPVLNRPTPQGLCGRIRHISEWIVLAARAGIPVPRYRQSSHSAAPPFLLHARVPRVSNLQMVLVVGSHAITDSAPEEIQVACSRLASLSRTPLLGVEFSVLPDGTWVFAGATPYPDLTWGGEGLLDTLMLELTSRSTS